MKKGWNIPITFKEFKERIGLQDIVFGEIGGKKVITQECLCKHS